MSETKPDAEAWRSHPSYLRAVAWIPDHDDNLLKWEELESLAVEWIERRADEEDVAPLVFFNARKTAGGIGPVQELASRESISYPLDQDRPKAGPVLAYHPDARSLRKAASLARGSSVVVIESTMTPLRGWAAGVQAQDLSGIYDPPPVLDPDSKMALDSAIFFTGNNNWTGSHEREHAKKVLHDVARSGRLAVDDAVGYALAHSAVHELGAKKLRAILEKLVR